MNKLITILLAIIVVGGAWIVFNDNDTTKDFQPSQQYTPSQTVDRLNAAEKQSFMRYCNIDGTLQSYCQCTLDHLERNNSAARIREMDREASDNYTPPEMWDAVNACIYLGKDYSI